jgi:acetyltransferase-like isoleucine patch superfamily enzyme
MVLEPTILKSSPIGADHLGYLNFLDQHQFPFPVRRVYWISAVPPDLPRGGHAHRTTDQLLICPTTAPVLIELERSNGKQWRETLGCGRSLVVPHRTWLRTHFNVGSALVVLASRPYDADDYIRDHDAFLQLEAPPPPHFEHPQSIVESTDIGSGTRIWAFAHVLPDVTIGTNCNICDHAWLESGVVVGNNVTIKNSAFLPRGVLVEDNAFIGPGTVFTNDRYPRSKQPMDLLPTRVGAAASIGANCTIVCGVQIGCGAMVGAGSVVTSDIPPMTLAYGNPARSRGPAPRSIPDA